MEKISRPRTTIYNQDIYISKDGQEFTDQDSCERHESRQRIGDIEKKDFGLYPFFEEFLFVKDSQTLQHMIKYIWHGHYKNCSGDNIKVGDWVYCRFDYRENGPDEYDLITVEEIKQSFGE